MAEEVAKQADISGLISVFKEELRNLKTELKEDFNNKIQIAVVEINNNFKNTNEQILSLQEEVSTLKQTVKKQDILIERLEKHSRRNNILLFSIKESEKEVLNDIIPKFITARLRVSVTINDFNSIRRIGKIDPKSTRPILVSFISQIKKEEVLSNKSNLDNTVWSMKSDYTPHQRSNRARVIKAAKILEQEGKRENY